MGFEAEIQFGIWGCSSAIPAEDEEWRALCCQMRYLSCLELECRGLRLRIRTSRPWVRELRWGREVRFVPVDFNERQIVVFGPKLGLMRENRNRKEEEDIRLLNLPSPRTRLLASPRLRYLPRSCVVMPPSGSGDMVEGCSWLHRDNSTRARENLYTLPFIIRHQTPQVAQRRVFLPISLLPSE